MPIVSGEMLGLYKSWWEGKNTDPLINAVYRDYSKYKSPSEAGLLKPWMEGSANWIFARAVSQAHEIGDMSPVTDALNIMELDLSSLAYAGAGFPSLFLNTGAGCLAALITGYAYYYNQTVWFELEKPWTYEKILSLAPDHMTSFAKTTLEAVSMAANHLKGQAVLTNLDLGGLADVLSSLRRTDGFLYDIIDSPDEVKASIRVIQEIWKSYFNKLVATLEPANDGLYSSWMSVLSDLPYYPHQCDACAMISPGMFEEFILPTLTDEFSLFERTVYHLDGSGEIPHLDMICAHPSLRAIQWVPEPTVGHADEQYHPLYKDIISHGKKIIFNGFRGDLDALADLFKKFPREAFCVTMGADNREEAERIADI